MKKPSEEELKSAKQIVKKHISLMLDIEGEYYGLYEDDAIQAVEEYHNQFKSISQMEQDDVIEKVKELRNEYLAKREHMDSFGINNALLLGRYEAYGFFIKKLNAIIEKP